MNAIKEQDGTTSGRKVLLLISAFIFTFACIGNLFGLPELPIAYTSILGGVFVFYFGKTAFGKIKVKTDE